jgi:hypothetical protein
VRAIAGIIKPLRSFVFKTPDDYGTTGGRTSTLPRPNYS